MNPTQFKQLLEQKGISITEQQMDQFKTYYRILVDYNKNVNLTSITEESEVYLKHFYDSLTLLTEYAIDENSTLCDVGAGAGFPSVPLKIMYPKLDVTIVDSLGKRCDFLKYLFKELNLDGIKAVHDRAEDFTLEARESFDYVTARAVARLNMLSELCIPLVKRGGQFIALKGANAILEYEEAKKGINTLGCSEKALIHFLLPEDGGERTLFVFEKTKDTPKKYPRGFGQIKKNPL